MYTYAVPGGLGGRPAHGGRPGELLVEGGARVLDSQHWAGRGGVQSSGTVQLRLCGPTDTF